MDSKLIAMKQYVCGEGVGGPVQTSLPSAFSPHQVVLKPFSERRLLLACSVSQLPLVPGYSLGFRKLSA